MKPFKTHSEQLEILRNRGLKIHSENTAIHILQNESYYSVINGYKDFFLLKDTTNKNIQPEIYCAGATFEEIYGLYAFDRDLRNTLLEYLLKFESYVKAKIAYRFSEKFYDPHAYLILKNYTRDKRKLKEILNLISAITNTISKNGNRKNSAIAHYLDKHEGVPLWVLINYLTIGNIQYFYACLDESLQNTIAKDFSVTYNEEYGKTIHYTPDMLEATLKTVTYFRNVCAHEERLYNFKIQKPSPSATIAKALEMETVSLEKGNVYTVYMFLKLVLPKVEHAKLQQKLTALFRKYESKFCSIKFEQILVEIGFTEDI